VALQRLDSRNAAARHLRHPAIKKRTKVVDQHDSRRHPGRHGTILHTALSTATDI
jgi:hypothetical protein